MIITTYKWNVEEKNRHNVPKCAVILYRFTCAFWHWFFIECCCCWFFFWYLSFKTSIISLFRAICVLWFPYVRFNKLCRYMKTNRIYLSMANYSIHCSCHSNEQFSLFYIDEYVYWYRCIHSQIFFLLLLLLNIYFFFILFHFCCYNKNN